MNNRGKVKNTPNAVTVSALLVVSPSASEMPAQAMPKNATVARISNILANPVIIVAPSRYANMISIIVCTMILEASLNKRPSRIALLLTGVTSIFERKPGVQDDQR